MKRTIVVLLLTAFCTTTSAAQTPQEDIEKNNKLSASNHVAYGQVVDTTVQLSLPPAGYEPFYIDHYGRHGSRWSTSKRTYESPVKILEVAERNGKLTDRGRSLLAQLKLVKAASVKREGELSDYGAKQHQGIAARMYKNFPQVFAGDAEIDAKSTVIIRCILSMLNETSTFKALNPSIKIKSDASMYDMPYMGWGHGEDTLAVPLRDKMYKLSRENDKFVNPKRFLSLLISDKKFACDSIDGVKLMKDVFTVAGSLQNHHAFDKIDLFDLFTSEEMFTLWRINNIYWYINWANAKENGNRMPFIEKALLKDMIESADRAIAQGRRGASLRFGHETCLLPLACLLEIDNVNYVSNDLSTLHEHWQNYKIFPMGCNIQMVFYKKINGGNADDVLVKVLFNEHEAKLPFETERFPYYRWNAIKGYYLQKASTAIDWAK